MNKKNLIIAISLLLIVSGLGAYGFLITHQPEPSISIKDDSAKNHQQEDKTGQNPEANNNSENNISVDSPQNNANLKLPFQISGKARVFENVLNVVIKDKANSDILYEGMISANAPDAGQFGEFLKTINYLYKKPTSADIEIEVFWFSPKDGTPLDNISIPAKLDLNNLMPIKVYFANAKLDPSNSCTKVFPLERIVSKTAAIGETALNALLEGPSYSESKNEYLTNINAGVKLNKLVIESGTAKADFDEQLQYQTGGSCRVESIRAQITQTLKQFLSVQNVIISINGKTEDILQP